MVGSLLALYCNVTGASFLWPFNTIYLHDHLGKSLSVAGMVLLLGLYRRLLEYIGATKNISAIIKI
ncbi:hypothetical protein ACT453_57775, partial [Bacillus sp. D-CC]